MSWNSEKQTKYINYFNNYKKYLRMTKKRSPVIIEFMTDDDSGWFITVVHYSRKSGKVSENFMITREEYEDRIDFYEKLGYQISEKF